MNGGSAGRGQLLCGLAILVALSATLVMTAARDGKPADLAGAGAPNERPTQATATLDPAELARISIEATPRVARRVERIRELEFDEVPQPRVVDGDFVNELSARELERTGATAGIGADEAEARIVGLLAPDEQLEDILGSTGDLAAAAYDTRRDRLYVIGDAVAANRALVEFVLAHELDHALEDERFGLPEDAGATDDGVLAQLALAEGSATAVMIDYGAMHIDPLDLLAATAGLDSGTGRVPEFFVDQLLWTYLGGQRFVEDLRRLDGGGWKLVDYALEARPPATTEQVIHTDKYLRDERAIEVAIESRVLRERGWRLADSGGLGELSTSRLLAVGADQSAADLAAQGWGGDAYELWRRGPSPRGCPHPCRDDLVLAIDWAWDRPDEVGEFEAAASAYVEQGLGGGASGSGIWTIEGGAVALRSAADESTLVFAPTPALAAAVAAQQVGKA